MSTDIKYGQWEVWMHDMSHHINRPEIFKSNDFRTIHQHGRLVYYNQRDNLIVKAGEVLDLNRLFGLGAAAVNALGAGPCSTVATINDIQLDYELIGNATRIALTNTAGAGLTAPDITAENVVIGGCTYQEKIVVQGVYTTGDGNNGQPFRKYSLFNTLTLPATPTSASGTMLNEFVDAQSILKTGSNTITVQITIRT